MATIETPRPQSTAGTGSTPVARPPRPFFLRSWFGLAIGIALVALFVKGWQVAEIDPTLLAQKSPRIAAFSAQILQPEVILHDQKQIQIVVPIPGVEIASPNVQPTQVATEVVPVIKSAGSQSSDVISPIDTNNTETYNVQVSVSANEVTPGQTLNVSGTGLRPNTAGNIVWQSTGTNASSQSLGNYKTDTQGNFSASVQVPSDKDRIMGAYGFPNSLVIAQTWDFGNLYISPTVGMVANLMVETVLLAFMGTLFAVIVSIPISFLASHNLMSHSLVTMGVYTLARTILNVLRSIDVLILCVIFAATIGLGPFAGTLALALHSIAVLGKLYSEAIESIDSGPIEAITATGANRMQVIVFAVVPQFIPQFISFTLYRWDANVRFSTVLGFVGGGGIGFILLQWINLGDWNKAATALWAIALVVIFMDFASSKVRSTVV